MLKKIKLKLFYWWHIFRIWLIHKLGGSVAPFDADRVRKLEKQIKKYTVARRLVNKKDTDGKEIVCCPDCGNILIKFWSPVETVCPRPYCSNCGQKLDWNLVEKK